MLRQVRRLSDATYAECRDCGRAFHEFESPYWSMGHVIGMHAHKNADGTWSKSGGVKRCRLYAGVYSDDGD